MTGSSHKTPRSRKRPRGFQGHVSEIDLRLLRVFHTVAEQGGFSAAEITLGKSKSSISLDISALETRLGLTICLRGRSGFALTDEGREVLEATRKLFVSLENFRQQINQTSGMLSGTFNLYVPDNIQTHGETPLVKAIHTFTQSHPGVFMNLHSASTKEVEVAVMTGQATAGIALYAQGQAPLGCRPLVAEASFLFCGSRHPLFHMPEEDITLDVLTSHSMVSVADAATSDRWEEIRPLFTYRAKADKVDARALLILSGSYMGFLPEVFAAPLVAQGLLRRIVFNDLRLITCCHFLARTSPETSLMVETFRTLLEASY